MGLWNPSTRGAGNRGRGPISFAREGRGRAVDHVRSCKALGIDSIRAHDFHGPTDWYVIFPDWSADPATTVYGLPGGRPSLELRLRKSFL